MPASGAAGLALGAWALRKSGMPAIQIAERSVAFFTIKSAANFVAVAVLGVLMFLGLGPSLSPLLTILPAALAILAIAFVVVLPRMLHEPERLARRGPKWAAFAKFVGATGDGLRAGGPRPAARRPARHRRLAGLLVLRQRSCCGRRSTRSARRRRSPWC